MRSWGTRRQRRCGFKDDRTHHHTSDGRRNPGAGKCRPQPRPHIRARRWARLRRSRNGARPNLPNGCEPPRATVGHQRRAGAVILPVPAHTRHRDRISPHSAAGVALSPGRRTSAIRICPAAPAAACNRTRRKRDLAQEECSMLDARVRSAADSRNSVRAEEYRRRARASHDRRDGSALNRA